MESTLNRYGEIEITGNEIKYFMPISRMGTEDIDKLEVSYKNKGQELMENPEYLFASDLEIVRNRFCFTFSLEGMKAFPYIRQFRFEEQVYYFRSLVRIAQNTGTKVLWDDKNMLVDLTDGHIKTFVFEFDNHPLYLEKQPLSGLKEMILLALTSLNRVIGKPRRIDFIDQREHIIVFAEGILRAKSIDEIEEHLEETILDIEKKSEEEKHSPIKKKKTMGILGKFKEKKRTIKMTAATVETPELYVPQKTNLPVPYQKKKNSLLDNKYVLLGVAVIAIVFLIAFMSGAFSTSGSAKNESEPKHQGKTEKKVAKVVSTTTLMPIYQEALSGDKKKALAKMEGYGYEHLTPKDQQVMLNLYTDTGQPEKAIQLKPDYANHVVQTYSENGQRDQLKAIQKKLKTENPVLGFEIAVDQQDWKKVIDLYGKVKPTEDRKKSLITAYVWTEQPGKADNFVQKDNSVDLYKHEQQVKKQYNNYKKLDEQKQNLNKKKTKLDKKKKKSDNDKKELKKTQNSLKDVQSKMDKIKKGVS